MESSINVNEALTALTEKPLYAADAERILIFNSLRGSFDNDPQPVRFGKMLYEFLNRVSVPLEPYDLIAGRSITRELIDEEEQIFSEFLRADDNPYGRTLIGSGHCTFSWDYLLEYGLPAMKERALSLAAEQTDVEKINFLKGAALIYDAIINWLHRYAEAADAAGKTDISSACREAADGKPSDFRSALQLLWAVTLVDFYLTANPTLALGRMDQLLLPYYRAGISSGKLTEERAFDLIKDYYCKHNLNMGRGEHQVGDSSNSTGFARIFNFDAPQYLMLGGTDESGNSAVNELTLLFVRAIEPKFKNPVVIYRYHKGDRMRYPVLWDTLVEKAMDSAPLMFYNDDDVVQAFCGMGMPLKDARSYSHFGCNWPDIGDKSAWMPAAPGSWQLCTDLRPEDTAPFPETFPRPVADRGWPEELMTILRELAEHEETLNSIDGVYEALGRSERAYLNQRLKYSSRELRLRQRNPSHILAFADCFYRDSIREARCFTAGAKYHFEVQNTAGIGTMIDCIITVDALVFRDRKLTLKRLVEAADVDFSGYEKELALCLSVPKYGSNDPFANEHTKRFMSGMSKILRECNKPYFESQKLFIAPSLQSDTSHLRCGEQNGATVDGRRAGKAYSQNSRPANGVCTNGLSGMLNSMLYIPFDEFCSGALNLDIQPRQFEGENGRQIFGALLGTYFDNGGLHAQVSSADLDDLLDAQIHPEDHRDLRVRVTGYSGIFVDICRRLQDDIIERMKG